MKYQIIWRLSGEPPLFLAADNDWTDNTHEALKLSDREEAVQLASVIGHGARVCLALSD